MDTQPEEKLVDKRELENGLLLELHDASKPMAGDRWLVSFIATINVDVRTGAMSGAGGGDLSLEELLAVLGEMTEFRYEKRSYFVDAREKDAVFDKLKKDFLDTNLGYLSSQGFAPKLILRKYKVAKGGMFTPVGIH